MTLAKLKVLLTAVGCPGGVTMIRALKDNGEREIEIVGTDMRSEAAGRFFVDRFYTVPAGTSPQFIPRLIDIVERERPDVLFPQSSYEVYPLAVHRETFEARNVPVMVASPHSIEQSNDKGLMYAALAGTGVPCPAMVRCSDLEAFAKAVHFLGYPERRVCFKPAIGKGSRGFRILDANVNRVEMLIDRRVDETTLTLQETMDILTHADPFPSLVVSEFVEGMEHTVDVLCRHGRVLVGFVKTREAMKAGLAMRFETRDEPRLYRHAETVVRALELDYFANIQFKGGKLIEVNPRVSTFVHQEDFNMPYLGIKYLLGEVDEGTLRDAGERVRTTRRTIRYYDQVFYDIDT